MRIKSLIVSVVMLSAIFAIAPSAWAVNSPEPQSGGRFFYQKGTKSAAEYRHRGRTGTRDQDNFEQAHYGNRIRYENLQINPWVGYNGAYDSNVFLTEDDADGDYISRLFWGVDADMPFGGGQHWIGGGVQSESEWFADNSSQNHTDFTYQLGTELNFTNFSIAVFDELRDTVDRSDEEFTQRVERYENFLTGLITVPFGEFFLETEVSHFLVNFTDDSRDIFDRNEFSVFPRVGINVGTRTQALLEYGYTHIGYEDFDARDGNAHQGSLGFRGFLGEGDLVSYQIWNGYQYRGYEGDAFKDFNNYVGRAEIVYQPSQLTQFIAHIGRKPVESTETGQSFYTRNYLDLRVRRQVAEKLFASLKGGVAFHNYSEDRDDFRYEPGVRLEYILPGELLALFADYTFSHRLSDQGGRDYARHLVNFGVKAEI